MSIHASRNTSGTSTLAVTYHYAWIPSPQHPSSYRHSRSLMGRGHGTADTPDTSISMFHAALTLLRVVVHGHVG